VSAGLKFDPTAYPRSYAPSRTDKVWIGLFGLALGIAGGLGAWYFVTGHDVEGLARVVMVVICVGVALLGLYCAHRATGQALVLTPQAIEVPGFFKVVRLNRRDIAGYRVANVQGTKVVVAVELRSGKTVRMSPIFETDALFDAWFAGIQDLDAAEATAEIADLQQDATLGADPEQRLVNLERARKIARVLGLLSVIVILWGWFYPHPYALMAAAAGALPWVALALSWKYGRLFTMETPDMDDELGTTPPPRSARADLMMLMLAPGIVLGWRAMLDVNLLDPAGLIVPSVVCGLLMAALALYVVPDLKRKRGHLALIAGLMMVYAAGAIPIANVLLDWGSAERYRVIVNSKWESGGRVTSQYFSVTAWGPHRADNEVQVPAELYRKTAVRQTACVLRRPGAFGLDWYVVARQSAC
jgi:hypothetical protein